MRVVLDNLNTHRAASLYETFPAAEARRIAKRLEFHYTPKHGSWLNMAEIEFSVLSRCCLKQRLPDEDASGGKSRHWCCFRCGDPSRNFLLRSQSNPPGRIAPERESIGLSCRTLRLLPGGRRAHLLRGPGGNAGVARRRPPGTARGVKLPRFGRPRDDREPMRASNGAMASTPQLGPFREQGSASITFLSPYCGNWYHWNPLGPAMRKPICSTPR